MNNGEPSGEPSVTLRFFRGVEGCSANGGGVDERSDMIDMSESAMMGCEASQSGSGDGRALYRNGSGALAVREIVPREGFLETICQSSSFS